MDLHLHRVPPRENNAAYAALQRWRMNEDEQRPSDKHMDDSGTAAWGKTSTLNKKGHIRWTLDKRQMDWSRGGLVSLLQQMLRHLKRYWVTKTAPNLG